MPYHGRSGAVTRKSPQQESCPARAPRLLDQVRSCCRVRQYSLRTERAYLGWIRRFILANGKRHPRDMGAPEVTAFLSGLATRDHVAASTQNQALSALLFLYRVVLDIELPWMDDVVRAKRPRRLPVVLSREEVGRLLASLDGVHWLMAGLLYGAGLRLMECLRLRVKDVDFARQEITVREGKGNKDRRVPLPQTLRRGARASDRARAATARARPRSGPRRSAPSGRAGAQIPAGGPRVGLAVRLSIESAFA